MCGIFAILQSRANIHEVRRIGLEKSAKLRHRGPDWSGERAFVLLDKLCPIKSLTPKIKIHLNPQASTFRSIKTRTVIYL